jgi:hypothetical protein
MTIAHAITNTDDGVGFFVNAWFRKFVGYFGRGFSTDE